MHVPVPRTRKGVAMYLAPAQSHGIRREPDVRVMVTRRVQSGRAAVLHTDQLHRRTTRRRSIRTHVLAHLLLRSQRSSLMEKLSSSTRSHLQHQRQKTLAQYSPPSVQSKARKRSQHVARTPLPLSSLTAMRTPKRVLQTSGTSPLHRQRMKTPLNFLPISLLSSLAQRTH